jgi:replicative DNA helicase
MNGGLAGGRFYIVGGIPSSGKTVLLNNIADNICLNGYPVLFFSYDDGKDELRYRSFARFSEHNIEAYNLNRIPDLKKVFVNPFIKQILSLKYVIKDMIPVEKWPDLVEQIKKKHGKGPVIIVDYLRKLKTESKTSDERLRVDDIINKLTQLAKNQNIPVVTISELARDSYKSGQRLSMASFKESGTIEYEASWLGILAAVVEGKNGEYILKDNWENIIAHDGNIDLIVFKAKRGTGQTGKVPLKVDKNKMTVMDRIISEPMQTAKTYTKKSIFD